MSTAQTLALGGIAGLTIFLGLPLGRMQNVTAATKAFLAATATGVLIFLFWDVMSGAVGPVETALEAGRGGRFAWLAFLLTAGFFAGLMSLVYYDTWMKRRRRRAFLGPGAASTAEFEHDHHFTGMSPARWLAIFIATGIGTHGLYPSRDGKKLYVANRGSNKIHGPPHGKGSVSVVGFATRKIEATWPIPGGGSPDMGNVSADGKRLWLAGRYDNVIYAIDTATGEVISIAVGREPHGLTVWPQPGRYSLGHTGNMR